MTAPPPGPCDPDDRPPHPDDPYAAVDYPDSPDEPSRYAGAPPPGYPPPPPGYPPPPPGYAPPGYPPPPSGYGYPPSHPGFYPDPYDPYRQAAPSGTNGMAIGSLVTSILAVPTIFFCVGFPLAIAGIVLGIVALTQTKRTGQGGGGLAIAGIVIGALTLVAGIVLIVAIAATGNYSDL